MSFAQTVSLDQVLACPNLPSLPSVAVDVLALTAKPNVNLEQIARVVQNDQALCAKILKTVNSSFYGLSKPCPTITRAISYLGLSTVKSLVLGFSLVDCTRSDKGFDLLDYWKRCIYSAAATRCIAARTAICDPEEAFITALMQDVGMPAIAHALGAAYQQIIDEAEGEHARLLALEQRALGFHHAKVGSMLAQRWRMPPEMIEAIRHHHTPDSASGYSALVRAVALGSYAAATLIKSDALAALPRFRSLAQQWFGIEPSRSDAMLSDIALEAKALARLFHINISASGAPDINAILAQAEEAALQHQLAVQRETEELRESNTNLARLALTDALTGAGNRKQFDTELPTLFSQARTMGGCLALIMIDADKFKNLNDTHGHQAGDMVLIELARRMMEQVKPPGIVCRYGGEEFAVVLPGSDRKAAARMAEGIRLAIANTPIDVSELQGPVAALPVTASLGVAVLEAAAASRINSPQLLVRAADKALYAAKESGRNCVRVFSLMPAAAAA